ncbi:hypothetical protein, partial [Phocaeicola plebeius]|uniref:hypothetical protein n=1 Tax=Phocaeicola plebeius TaxID=310297 RepID=UPI001C70AB34
KFIGFTPQIITLTLLLPDSFFPSFFPLLSFFPLPSPGRPSEMRLETFSPQRRVILYWSIQTSSERMKTV